MAQARGKDAAEVLPAAPSRRQALPGRARIDRVVIDLRGIEAAAADHLEARLGVAGDRQADGTNEALLPEPIEGIGDAAATEHLRGAQCDARAHAFAEMIVQLAQC